MKDAPNDTRSTQKEARLHRSRKHLDGPNTTQDKPLTNPLTAPANTAPEPEFGGPAGPEPTRFGDWERKGRCIDF